MFKTNLNMNIKSKIFKLNNFLKFQYCVKLNCTADTVKPYCTAVPLTLIVLHFL